MIQKNIFSIACFWALCISIFLIPTLALSASPKPVDLAKPAPFEVLLRNGNTYCISLELVGGHYYAYEKARAGSSTCQGLVWRYDVQGHIATTIEDENHNERYMCLTDMAGQDKERYYYVEALPCSINNERQIWHYNADDKQMISQYTGTKIWETNWYFVTIPNPDIQPDVVYPLEVTGTNNFLNTITAPLTIAYDLNFHYDANGQTQTSFTGKNGRVSQNKLRYDPTSKQISIFQGGVNYCLRSNQVATSLDSEFISFTPCSDSYASGIVPHAQRWELQSSVMGVGENKEYKIVLRDYDGNYFGVETGGLALGNAFTIKGSKLASIPALFKPKYVFNDAGETFGRQGYFGSNYVGTLKQSFCPAPGVFKKFDEPAGSSSDLAVKAPQDLDLNVWANRLYLLSRQASDFQASGACGGCLLHSIEILLEIDRFGNNPPQQGLDAQFYTITDPTRITYESFEQRYPALATEFNDLFEFMTPGMFAAPNSAEDIARIAQYINSSTINRLIHGAELSINSAIFFNDARNLSPDDVQPILQQMLAQPIGTAFTISASVEVASIGAEYTHSIYYVRLADGIHVIPTTESGISLAQFTSIITGTITTQTGLYNSMRLFRPLAFPRIYQAVLFTYSTTPEDAPALFDLNMVSVGNCTDGGAAGGSDITTDEGSGIFIADPNNLFNMFQCSDGRCDSSSQ